MDLNELINKQEQLNIQIEGEEEEKLIAEGSIIQLVSFVLEDVEYGVDILLVHEILRFPEITRLPNAPDFIKGVINLRGNVIPVVDVRKRFGFSKAKVTDLTRIIVIETNDKLTGLMVDNVHQVVRITQNNVDPPSELIEGVSEEYIWGIGRLKDRLIVILNLANILFLEEDQEN
jgi:purine-binding chemotaxis protein CheW